MGYELGLSDREFWESTLYTLQMRAEAQKRKVLTLQRLLAWHAANIMNVQIKGTVRPEQLMGDRSADATMESLDRVWLESLEKWLEGKGKVPW